MALFIALGGTVYAAGKISGKQIKPRSLPGNRIKLRTITANRIKAKTLTGRQIRNHSLTADQINQGTLTGISAAALADLQYQVRTVPLGLDSSAGTTATVTCPSGTSVVGGGAIVSDDEAAFVNDSGPNSQQTGWTATGLRRSLRTATMTITVICVPVGRPSSDVGSETGAPVHPFPIYEPF